MAENIIITITNTDGLTNQIYPMKKAKNKIIFGIKEEEFQLLMDTLSADEIINKNFEINENNSVNDTKKICMDYLNDNEVSNIICKIYNFRVKNKNAGENIY